jgi:hypothetical protein
MYRANDPRAALAHAHAACEARYVELVQARASAFRASAKMLELGRAPLVVPDYEPLGPLPAAQDHEIPALIARFESLTAYYAGEVARLRQGVDAAQAGVEDLYRPRALAPGPRKVPFVYVAAELLRGYWIVFRWMLFPPLGMVSALALGGMSVVFPALPAAPLFALSLYALFRALARIRMLAHGEVVEIVSRAYAPGMGTSKNWPRQIARGWNVTVEGYTGSSYNTTLAYRTSAGVMGSVTVGGPKYEGFILAYPSNPQVAMPLTAFGSVPRPDASGQWESTLPTRVWIWSWVTVAMILAWLGVPLYLTLAWFEVV